MNAAPSAIIDRVKRNLVGLRMPRALEILDVALRAVERGEATALDVVDILLAEELTLRENRRVRMALQMARLSAIKTLAGFDFSFQPSLDKSRVMALAELQFIDRAEAVHLTGRPAPGKRISAWRSASKRSKPAAASTSPPSPTSSRSSPEPSARERCGKRFATSAVSRC
ncbi:hypothetical protein MSC49_40610 (plasmid) [Methylosinus sp. C49]|nr:hypothetical protein MSC49_40610 [Methylosinus sp. C49]